MSTPLAQPPPDSVRVFDGEEPRPRRRLTVAVTSATAAVLTRRSVSAACAVGSVAAATAGAWVLWGIGWALLTVAGMLLGLGVLLGWE